MVFHVWQSTFQTYTINNKRNAQAHPNIKEEPKGGVQQSQSLSGGGPPLREILGAATNHGSPSAGNESPHPSFHYAAAAAAAASGFPTGNCSCSNWTISFQYNSILS